MDSSSKVGKEGKSTGRATGNKNNPSEIGSHNPTQEYVHGPTHPQWNAKRIAFLATVGVSLREFCKNHNVNYVMAQKARWVAGRKAVRAKHRAEPAIPTKEFVDLPTAAKVRAISDNLLNRLYAEGSSIDIEKALTASTRLVEAARALESSSKDQAAGAAVAAYKAKSAPLIAGALARIVAAEFVAGQAERTGVAVDAVRDLMDAALDEIEARLVAVAVAGKE